ncbi:MAG: DUF4956 domain-containing protein [Proteobacteria bacterium]|nr:DUF4956 domain-containing protein [Pseudomonadota bacterium]
MDGLNLQLPVGAPLSIATLLFNLGVGVVLALLLRWHFERFGSTLTNRMEFAQVFPFILLTTVLIITVVKSSLALSLGLVGALSIVRFRTPIKEPEELAYLFMAIAIGLGLGANQTVPTVVASLAILVVIAAMRWARRDRQDKNLYLSIDLARESEGTGEEARLERLNEILARHAQVTDLRRVDSREGSLEATYFVDFDGSNRVSELIDELNQAFPGVGVSFIDQNQLPSI